MPPSAFTLIFLLFLTATSSSQTFAPSEKAAAVVCDEAVNCSHQFINGQKFRTLVSDGISLTVSVAHNAKYARATILVSNTSGKQFDVLPEQFSLKEITPKERDLAYIPYEKIVKADARRAGWANALNAFGAGMATQPVTTQTTTSGSVNATGSDGSYANGNYTGTSTSTTDVPNYAAQAQARENIQRRRAALAAEEQTLSQSALRDNSIPPGKSVSGEIYYEFDKKGEDFSLTIPIGGRIYVFPLHPTK